MNADGQPPAPAPSGEAHGASPRRKTSENEPNAPLRLHRGGKTSRLATSHSLHASCVVVRESGILIRGASGAGKSNFASLLLAQARAQGEFAAWVADDRVVVTPRGHRLIGAPHRMIAGRFEARGVGILAEPHEPRAVLCLVVDLEEAIERYPERSELIATVAGVALRRLPLVAGRAGLYEASLVLNFVRMRQESESRPTWSFRVGTVGI
jgi:hypothetical protein